MCMNKTITLLIFVGIVAIAKPTVPMEVAYKQKLQVDAIKAKAETTQQLPIPSKKIINIQESFNNADITNIYNTCIQRGLTSQETALINVENSDMKNKSEYLGERASYAPYYGRGYIQLTHKSNYQNASKWFGIDLIADPDILVKDFQLSAKIACDGIKNGSWTGKKASHYDLSNADSIWASRAIVNGDANKVRKGHNEDIGNMLVNYYNKYCDVICVK